MSRSTPSKPRKRRLLLLAAVWTPILVASAVFLSLISVSMVPRPPAAELVDLGRRVKAARSDALSGQAARELDQAAATLEAARRAIERESRRSWTLRSYDRARTLLWRTEKSLERAQRRPPAIGLDDAVPAG